MKAENQRSPQISPDPAWAELLAGVRAQIVVAPYYRAVATDLVAGASRFLDAVGIPIRIQEVPGAFEIPPAIAHLADLDANCAFVALGCVIRGDTSHYDYVCGQTARALMDLSVGRRLAIGYGILTCETLEQAELRAAPEQGDKGGEAAQAALSLLAIKLGASQ